MSKDTTFKLPSQRQRELLASATTEYTNHVETALPYLMSRGITADMAERWQLGYVKEPLSSHERFKGYLAIPYITPAGPVAMKFRCISCTGKCEGHPKYDSTRGEGTYLFNAQALTDGPEVVAITEGELDAISGEMAGIPTVGISGATKWLSHWEFVFETADLVIVFLDGDEPRVASDGKIIPPASQLFERNVLGKLSNARSVQLPLGEDVNSVVCKFGAGRLREMAGLT